MNCCSCQAMIENVCQNQYQQMFTYPNVVGMGFGYKVSQGIQTNNPVICVMVSQKCPISQLNPTDVIPSCYQGFQTDVVESGEFVTHALTSYIRPMVFGYSIGPQGVNLAGTAGWLVRSLSGPPAIYILSNNHVMANTNSLPLGTPILQPAQLDGGVPANAVATLSKYIPVSFQGSNTVDAAIANVINSSNIQVRIANIGVPTGINTASVNLSVKKTGRTTGFTTGVITSTGATVSVTYDNGNVAVFTNQIVTTAMSSPGDSGSLLVDTSNKAIGLLFAGSTSATIYNPIRSVLSALSVGLVSAYGTVT